MTRKFDPPEYKPTILNLANDDILITLQGKEWLYDIEVYENYVLIAAMEFQTGWCVTFEVTESEGTNRQKLKWFVENNTLIGFNSKHFDQYLLWAVIEGWYVEQLKALSDGLIFEERSYQVAKRLGLKVPDFDHIDLMPVAPAAAQKLSLKHYGGRMHVRRMQDLPYDVSSRLTSSQKHKVKEYCINDLIQTGSLYHCLRKPMALRKELSDKYNTDVRSLSDAQIAEKALGSELTKVMGERPKRPPLIEGQFFQYNDPGYFNFQTHVLQDLKESIFATDFTTNHKGHIKVGQQLADPTNLWKVKIGDTTYKVGIGGLHSSEKKRSVYSTETHQLYDRDVESYYPVIILNQGLYPQHLGSAFLEVYREIYNKRVEAKRTGNKSVADALKITINGCFGKLGSMWSIFFSPELRVQVTLTGQLALLLLIERFEMAGIPVVSANTDGVVVNCPRSLTATYLAVVAAWEADTQFKTEETVYDAVHSRDVNSYIAICPDGKIKAKGEYVNDVSMVNRDREALMTNPNFQICSEAAMLFLQTCRGPHPITIDKTIKGCKDFHKFIAIRKVKGGAIRDQCYLGKVIRWYIRENDHGAIYYKNANAAGSTNRVAETDGGCPVMEMPDKFPKDINYGWYIRRAHSILRDVGFGRKEEKQLELFG